MHEMLPVLFSGLKVPPGIDVHAFDSINTITYVSRGPDVLRGMSLHLYPDEGFLEVATNNTVTELWYSDPDFIDKIQSMVDKL